MYTLTDYRIETNDLLRDSGNLFFSVAQINRYINKARQEVAKRTGCIRILIPGQAPFGNSSIAGTAIAGGAQAGVESVSTFQTISGVEKYPFSFANPYVRKWNAGVKGIIDVIDVAVSWGGIRPALSFLPWDDLQAYARSYNVGVTSYPFFWSTNGDGERAQVWLFPVPNMGVPVAQQVQGSQGEMEWDTICVPKPLYSDTDIEAIPEPFQQEVSFFAAHLALLGAQRYGAANIMLDLFNDHLGIDRVASDRGKTASYYWSGV